MASKELPISRLETKNCGLVSIRRVAMTNITRRRTNRIQSQLGVGCLIAVCLMTASVPSGFAKKSAFRTQEGSASIPAGTTLNVRMIDELDTAKTQKGDSFRASLDRAVVVDGRTVASKDAFLMCHSHHWRT